MAKSDGFTLEAMQKPDRVTVPKLDLKEALAEFANARQVPVVSVLLPNSPLEKRHVLKLRRDLAGRQYEVLDLIIHSGGGDIHAAYQMIEVLRMHSKEIRAVVPLYAKSAATLLCLGSDGIVMDELAELGPLDTQMGEFEGGAVEFKSALNPFKTLEQLRSFSLETVDLAMKMIVDRCTLRPAEALDHAIKLVGTITTPLYSQLSPETLGESSRALLLGMEYGERLLRRHSKFGTDQQAQILNRLVYGYPSHDFVVDHHEAKELGLSVKLFTDTERETANKLLKVSQSAKEVSITEPTVMSKPGKAVTAETKGGEDA